MEPLPWLTVGDVPTDLARNKGRCGVWLTSDEQPHGHGLDGGALVDKKAFRLTVDLPDSPLLVKWTDWAAAGHVTPVTLCGLHETAPGFESWYVYFGVIARTYIIECVDMQTGRPVNDWARPLSPLDVKPVPPRRRAAWHKRLLKDVRSVVSR